MAISRDKKNSLVAELVKLFANTKSVVSAAYTGLNVANLQELRTLARDSNVTIKVAKNRLVRVALLQDKKFKDADTSLLNGQLIYAFSSEDEIAPIRVLAQFAKNHPQLQPVVGFNEEGSILDATLIKIIAELPTNDQLRRQVVGVLAAPLTQILGVLNGAQHGFTQVLSQRAATL
jgi:large subunit ribosomal protein L10